MLDTSQLICALGFVFNSLCTPAFSDPPARSAHAAAAAPPESPVVSRIHTSCRATHA